jgi:hypothetical protein
MAARESPSTTFIRQVFYGGPAYRQLYLMRRQHPELASDLDEIALALRQTGDLVEAYVQSLSGETPAPQPAELAPDPSAPDDVGAASVGADETARHR